MAYVVARPDGRFEIRESHMTPQGPRCRTLATFRELTDAVLDHAQERATTRFAREVVAQRAVARGAPDRRDETVALARGLLSSLAAGRTLPPAWAALLRERLADPGDRAPDTLAPMVDWLAASMADRGETLRDLLRMTDRLPPRPARRGRRFPRIHSTPA